MLKYCTATCDEVTKNPFSLRNIQWAIKQRVGLIYWIHSSTTHKLIARKQRSAGQMKWAFAMKPYWNKYDRPKLLSLSGASAFYILFSHRNSKWTACEWMKSCCGHKTYLDTQATHVKMHECDCTGYEISNQAAFIWKRHGTISLSEQNIPQKEVC